MQVAATLNRVIYLDGSALCRFLPGVRHHAEWGAWASSRVAEFVTSQLGFTELRQAADLYPRRSMDRVLEIVETVRSGVGVIRFSDNDVTISSHATAVLKPFAALHLGAAVGHDGVDTIATYDPALASVARMYDLTVVSPGLPDDWYMQFEGPPEDWKPVALDAPYEPGAEFDLPEVAPKKDMYDEALEEAKAAAAAGPVPEDEVSDDEEDDGETSTEEATESAEGESDESPSEPIATDDAAEGESDESPSEPIATTESAEGESDESPSEPVATDDAADDDEPQGDDASDEAPPALEEMSEFDRALREAEAAVLANGVTDDESDEDGDDVSEEDGTELPHAGTYRPRIEAWRGPEDGDDPGLEPVDEDTSGDGLPWSKLPEPPKPASPAGPPGVPKPPAGDDPVPPRPPAPPSATPAPPRGVIAADASISEPPPALAPPDPAQAVDIPTIPREERGVPPVAPPRNPGDAPPRRPMFDTDPHPDSRASRPPEPVPTEPPEESQPLTVPITWNVELDEPESIAPRRNDAPFPRVPSQPVTQEVRPGGLTLDAPSPDSVPGLEPPNAAGATPAAAPPPPGVVAPPPPVAKEPPLSPRERKAREKAAKKERERREKAAKKNASPPAPKPAPKKDATPAPAPEAQSTPPPANPPATSSEGDASWKLEDVIDVGKGKRRK